MPDYCGECAYWICSSDTDRFGRRFCAYVRRYEVSVQIATGYKGFTFSSCIILRKLCEILHEPAEPWLEAYNAIREGFAAPEHLAWLSAYFSLDPQIADQLDRDSQRVQAAKKAMRKYMKHTFTLWQEGKLEEATFKYMEMIADMANRYLCS